MTDYLGAKHTLGFKPQATPGTPETTVTTFLATRSINVNPNPNLIERKTFAGTGRMLPSRLGSIEPTGKAMTEVMASQPHPWYWAMGANDTTQPAVGTDPTVYLHTITDGGAPIPLTCEADQVYDQAKQGDVAINKIKLAAQAGEIATMELEWFALSHEDGATFTSTPAFVTDVMILTNCTASLAGSANLTIPEVELEWDGLLEALQVLADSDGAPSVIRRKGIPTIKGKLKFIDLPAAEVARLRAAGTFALVLTFLGATISNAYRKSLTITLPACQYTGGLDPDIEQEVLTGEADFEAFYDLVTSKQITVASQNTIASIEA